MLVVLVYMYIIAALSLTTTTHYLVTLVILSALASHEVALFGGRGS